MSQLYQHYLLKSLFFAHQMILLPKNQLTADVHLGLFLDCQFYTIGISVLYLPLIGSKCFDYLSIGVFFEVRKCKFPLYSSFFKTVLTTLGPLQFHLRTAYYISAQKGCQNFVTDCPEYVVHFASTNSLILNILNLERGDMFLINQVIFFSNVLYLQYLSLELLLLTPGYFILLDVILMHFFLFWITYCWQIETQTAFCLLSFYPTTFLNQFIRLSSFLMDSLGFPEYRVMSFANRNSFTFSFPTWMSFGLTSLARTSSILLNHSARSGCSYIVLYLRNKVFSLLPLSMILAVVFS